ncbi:MAG: hypothetical protein WCD43_00110 [Candidatus Acidiferrales bacterium]
MKIRPSSGATPLYPRSSRGGVARPRRSEESGFAFLMALGLMLIVLALSLVVLQNYVTDGKRTKEEETIWRGQQYARAIRLYYHKMGHYPQTMDDLQKGGLQLHFLRQAYKNPMNKTDGTWRFIYVNATGQITGSVRYATLQQMVLIDQYAGLVPGGVSAAPTPGQIGVPAASLASVSAASSPQLQGVLSGILSSVPPDTDTSNGSSNSTSNSASNGTGNGTGNGTDSSQLQSGTSLSGSTGQTPDQSNGQPPAIVAPTADQVNQFLQNGQLPPGITQDMVNAYLQNGQLPAGITQAQVNQFIQNFQSPQSQQNPTQSTLVSQTFGPSGSSSFGSSSTQPGAGPSGGAINPLLLIKPTGPVEGPVLGGFLTGVACTTDIKSIKVYRRGKKYKEWEFIWNPLEDALASAQQGLGGAPQGVLPGQSSGIGGFGAAGGGIGGNSSSSFGNPPTPPTSPAPQQPPTQQPQ